MVWADERTPPPPSLLQVAAGTCGPLAVLVGPEGGLAEVERAEASARGRAVSLGSAVLRAETAGVAAVAVAIAARRPVDKFDSAVDKLEMPAQ